MSHETGNPQTFGVWRANCVSSAHSWHEEDKAASSTLLTMAAQLLNPFATFFCSRHHVSRRYLIITFCAFFSGVVFLTHQLGTFSFPTLPIPSLSSTPDPDPSQGSKSSEPPPAPHPDQPADYRIWEPPELDPIVHGIHVSEVQNTKPFYPLDPFPTTPMVAPPLEDKRAPWLAAVICAPWDGNRRMMIRSSWMRLYQDIPFDGRFVISNPGPQWIETIKLENSTFGDMIVLDTLEENDFTANTIKTLEFYNWLLKNSPKKYQFVSKMDTDLWLNARAFWSRFLVPRMSDENGSLKATVNHTILGQLYYSPPHRVVFPHGSMYTVTWDMVEMLVSLQDKHHVIAGEDLTMAVLLLKAKEKATVVNFKGSEKFDYDDNDTRPGEDTAWAPHTTVPSAAEHALYGGDIIAIHRLKSDKVWLKVADCFDEQGVKKMPPEKRPLPPESESDSEQEGEKPKPKIYSKSRFYAIPADYWEFRDERWLCNGIWNLEHGIDQNPDTA